MHRTLWARAALLGSAAVLAVLVWRLGTGPFLRGVRAVDGPTLAAAIAIAGATSVCSAWRWRTVARGLGVDLPLGVGVAACYRSVFLNTVLPGGLVGDVHRGMDHGRDVGDIGRALRAVAWERTAGQVVQAVLTTAVLLALPSPLRPHAGTVAAVLVTVGLGAVLLCRTSAATSAPSAWVRMLRTTRADVREGLLAPRALPAVVLASAVIVAGHAATFVLAAHAAGVVVPLTLMLPLALLVLTAMALPNAGWWGPREGVTAWAFGAVGLGAAQGVSTAVAYGVLATAAALPGAVVLLAPRLTGGAGGYPAAVHEAHETSRTAITGPAGGSCR
ncbi:MAG: lysylphosphatidylglycerol synthase transmembrane domain-containing protein [Actinomycetes bacterium]